MGNQPIQPYTNTGGGASIITPYTPSPAQGVAFQFWQKPVYQATSTGAGITAGELWCPGCDGSTYASNSFDYLSITAVNVLVTGIEVFNGQIKTPGICAVEVGKDTAIDEKKPVGANGARLTLYGLNVGRVTIRITIWTPEQLKQLARLWELVFSPSGKTLPTVCQVSHPLFIPHAITAVQFLGADGPVLDSQRRGVFTIKAVEFKNPATNATSKPVVKSSSPPLKTVYDKDPSYPAPGSNSTNLGP